MRTLQLEELKQYSNVKNVQVHMKLYLQAFYMCVLSYAENIQATFDFISCALKH